MATLASDFSQVFTIEVFGLDDSLRASGRVNSIPDAMAWVDATSCCLDPRECLMVRIEGPNHFGCWMYVSAPGGTTDWAASVAAKQIRRRVEQRRRRSNLTPPAHSAKPPLQ